MNRLRCVHIPFLLSLIVATALAAGCTASEGPAGSAPAAEQATRTLATAALDPLLAQPKVGDLWASELSHFSVGEFSDSGREHDTVFGLMKVVDTSDENIVLITETGAWPKKQGAINDLRGDLADIEWDEKERITVRRSELAELVGAGRIIETRRL
ncbi:hypothetical protein [Pseudoxanthomonas koreensis]|uniref:hypothetical protein n=1 Tax=Pseudoxanthomonas koreensis TaxID=266061 RepID=UPI0035A740DC